MLLREIVENKRYIFVDAVESWQDSIKMGCRPLAELGIVEESYAEEIIACVEKHGPYIVVLPNIAIPHAMQGACGANSTAIGFMKVERPVVFDENDNEKNASVFFTIASTDTDQHLENMKRLFAILTDEQLCVDLVDVKTPDDLLRLDMRMEAKAAEASS